MYQTVSEYPLPPRVDRDRFVAVNKQWNANKFNNLWKYLDQRVLRIRVVSFSRSEILEIIPTILKSYWLVIPVSNRRELVNTMKVILDCPGSYSW